MTKVAKMPISLIAAGGFEGVSPLYNYKCADVVSGRSRNESFIYY
jgi:hypothetical protein